MQLPKMPHPAVGDCLTGCVADAPVTVLAFAWVLEGGSQMSRYLIV